MEIVVLTAAGDPGLGIFAEEWIGRGTADFAPLAANGWGLGLSQILCEMTDQAEFFF